MANIISWVRPSGGWVRSSYGDLPALRADDAAMHQTWLILAGGIALVLSRASRAEVEERFAAARQVYDIARARLAKRRLPKPDPDLLRDALQEIGHLADPMTREAGRECMVRCLERFLSKTRGATGAPTTSGAASSLQSTQTPSTQQQSTQLQTQLAPHDEHEATQIDLDLLFERSNKLRGTVAWARTTTFGQDS
jgi:hypothetical protein